MGDEAAFEALSNNRVAVQPYIAVDGAERHYRLHARIAAAAFPGRPFEEVAAVTELFHCATEDASSLPRSGSPCADRYLARVIAITQPRVIVAVGKPVEAHLRPRFGARDGPSRVVIGGVNALVVPVPHPNARGEKSSRYEAAAAEVVAALGGPAPTPAGDPAPDPEGAPAAGVPGTAGTRAGPAARWPWLLLSTAGIVTALSALCYCGGGS